MQCYYQVARIPKILECLEFVTAEETGRIPMSPSVALIYSRAKRYRIGQVAAHESIFLIITLLYSYLAAYSICDVWLDIQLSQHIRPCRYQRIKVNTARKVLGDNLTS